MSPLTAKTEAVRTQLSPQLRELGLEEYVLQLEVDGLAIVPPEVHGVTEQRVDELARLLLERAEEIVGCPFDLGQGPLGDIEFPVPDHVVAELAGDDPQGVPSQFLIQQLCSLHRSFRDLALNPVAVALMHHMIGARATRFSSHNSFVDRQVRTARKRRTDGESIRSIADSLGIGQTTLRTNLRSR